jgi:hypothetical protein
MVDMNVVPGLLGDDREQEVEKVTFEVYRDGEEGYIYWNGDLLYDREADENGEDDLFEALARLGQNMEKRGHLDFIEKDGGRGCE